MHLDNNGHQLVNAKQVLTKEKEKDPDCGALTQTGHLSTPLTLLVFPLPRLINVKIQLEAVFFKLCKVKELFVEVLLKCLLTLSGGPGQLPFENLEVEKP